MSCPAQRHLMQSENEDSCSMPAVCQNTLSCDSLSADAKKPKQKLEQYYKII